MLFYSFTFSQLSVRNSTFIYSDDTVIFVEDDVNIEESTAAIYLRNGAQLLQGSGNTGNSGIGKLSIYQNGTTHNYAYNYWCSPVGNTDADDNINRQFRANNNIYDVTTAPTTSSLATYTTQYDGTSSPLVISNRWLYTFSPGTSYSEWDYAGDSGVIDSGYGYTMKGTSGSSNNQLYDFRGKPNNGDILSAVNFQQFTLVGNPYPSALDSRDYIWDADNSTINGTLYFWEQDLSVNSHYTADYVGGYATYTISSDASLETYTHAPFNTYTSAGVMNTSGSPRTSGKNIFRYIPVGQGFMVYGAANGLVSTKNSHREYIKEGAESEFFRTNDSKSNIKPENRVANTPEGFNTIPNEYKRFRVNIDFNDVYTRQLVHNFHDSASDLYDRGLESVALRISNDAYWLSNNTRYVVQANKFDEDLKLRLSVRISESQPSIRFRLLDVQNFDETQPIYLHDKETDIYYDLRNQDFEINNLSAGNHKSRFEITFKNATLNITENSLDTTLQIFQNNTDSELTIVNSNNFDINKISLYDIGGKLIVEETNFSKLTNKYTYKTDQISTGVYFVKIKIENSNELITEKVIIEN